MSEMELCMKEAWELFKSEHPNVGETHEKIFRYAYVTGWNDSKCKTDAAVSSARKDGWDDY